MIKLERALVFFDLETTGVSPTDDRIIDIALLKRLPGGGEESLASLVDPGMPIPPESIAVHHITDEMVRGQPSFKDLAPRLLSFIGDADLGGFGILRFDVPLLQVEFRRAGIELPMEGRRLVDALAVFHRMEPRNLAAAYKFYCGKPFPEAHRAEPDARAAAEVLFAQVERYPDLPKDIGALSAWCTQKDVRSVDAEGKFVWRNGEAAFNFGKHRTLTLREVVARERSYVEWLMKADRTTPELARICREALAGRFPAKPEA
jgi:DNA polymerase-3 subunit epsilon